MGKYDPLFNYLRRQRVKELELSFADIERLIRGMLPRGAEQPQWWTGPAANPVQQKAWTQAGYEAALVVGKDRVRFTRAPRP